MFRTLTPTLSVLVAIFLFVFFVNPQYKEIKGIIQETAEYQEATQNYTQFNTQIQNLLSKKDSINDSDRERLYQFVPDGVDSSHLLVDIEGMAKQNGMLFGNIIVEDASDIQPATRDSGQGGNESTAVKTELRSMDISFDVIGTYEQFKAFASNLESSLTLLEIVEISMTTEESQFQQYSVTVRTYSLPETSN